MHELMDVGGPDLDDDPVIIRRAPTTYVYPAGTGRLDLGEDTIYLDAPIKRVVGEAPYNKYMKELDFVQKYSGWVVTRAV